MLTLSNKIHYIKREWMFFDSLSFFLVWCDAPGRDKYQEHFLFVYYFF